MPAEPETGHVYSINELTIPTAPGRMDLPPGVQFEPLDDAREARVSPRVPVFLGANADAKEQLYQAMTRRPLPPAGVFRVAGGEILGRGLIAARDRTLLAGAAVTDLPQSFPTIVWGAVLTRRADNRYALTQPGMIRRRIDGPVIVGICPGFRIYGHILIDWIPRVMMAAAVCGPDVPIVVPDRLPDFARSFLNLLGIDPGRLVTFDETREIVTADELVLGSQVRAASGWWPGAARFLQPLTGHAGSGNDLPRRFYVCRDDVRNQRRRLLQRDQVDAALRQRGFVPVAPEKLPLTHQIALFARAEQVVGEAGSGLHNSVFGKPELRMGVMQADTLGSFLQGSLCGALGQSVAFAFGDTVSFAPTTNFGDFILAPDALQAMLDHVVKS